MPGVGVQVIGIKLIIRLIKPLNEYSHMAISRNIEYQTGISIKQFVKLLRPIRSGIVTINGNEFLAEPEIPDTVKSVLNSLGLGH